MNLFESWLSVVNILIYIKKQLLNFDRLRLDQD